MDYTPYIEGIKKTGFPLEHKVALQLRDRKWTVIANRYYVDNDEERPREVDIVAYRYCNLHPDFDLFTTVILSCKKSDHSVWTFLAREAASRDPNTNREPFHHYSGCPAFNFMRSEDPEWPKTYHKKILSFNLQDIFKKSKTEIFALQELSNGNGEKSKGIGKPLGDSAMFSAVMSLMKAQYYELSVKHKKKRKKPAIYQLNLLSIVDGEMIEFKFDDSQEIKARHVLYENYIARYIFDSVESFSRIVFTTHDNLCNALEQYERLHVANQKIFAEVVNDFYKDVVHDTSKLRVFEEEFFAHLSRKLRVFYLKSCRQYDKLNVSSIWFNKENSVLEIGVDNIFLEIEFLNDSCLTLAKDAVRLFYKYEGDVIFDESLPF